MSVFKTMQTTLYNGIAEGFGQTEADDPSYNLDWLTWTAIRAVPEAITTKDEAQHIAVMWQSWVSDSSMSYGQLSDWQAYFQVLADRFDLADEFKENGII